MAVELPIDHLADLWPRELRGRRVGALLHPASVNSKLEHTSKILERENGKLFQLAALFGPQLNPDYRSFVGMHPIRVRHGKTIGELATQFRDESFSKCALTILPMKDWERAMWFDQTGLPWVMPSPNMPTLDTATVYPGMCLLEGTNVSEGRGTNRPFEIFGAPWIDPEEFCRELNALNLPGTRFREMFFQPTCHKFSGQVCGGAKLHVTDRDSFR